MGATCGRLRHLHLLARVRRQTAGSGQAHPIGL